MDLEYQPCGNMTLDYTFAETGLGMNKIDVNEDSEVVFRVPEGHLVTFVALSKFKPLNDNPSAFVAKDKMVVYVVFDTRVSSFNFRTQSL